MNEVTADTPAEDVNIQNPAMDVFYPPEKVDPIPEAKPEDTEAKPDDAPEASEVVEDKGEIEAAPKEGESEEREIETLSELAEHFELESDYIDGLKITTKVNGEDSQVTVKDLVASHQKNAAADERLEEAKVKSKAASKEIADKTIQLEAQFNVAAAIISDAEQMINEDFADINWAELKENDEGAYAARKGEQRERKEAIEALKAKTVAGFVEAQQERAAEINAELETQKPIEQEKLLKFIPEWKDDEKAEKGKIKLSNYIVGELGFSPEEFQNVFDHRIYRAAYGAMMWEQSQKDVDVAKKKVVLKPKIMKPGGKSSKPKAKNRSDVELLYGS